jgi:hypothetical protein
VAGTHRALAQPVIISDKDIEGTYSFDSTIITVDKVVHFLVGVHYDFRIFFSKRQ